jgi:2-oxoglutarate/2-oxoacid ferredoxin oxidoreductase subunit alpha
MNEKILNDFSITFSTINGSGSATANNILLKAIHSMGIPVSGKNIFPSNIQGMPTWYTLRLNKNGFVGRKEKDNILVAMNPATIQDDIEKLTEPGVLLFDEIIKPGHILPGIKLYSMPVEDILKQAEVLTNLKTFLSNIIYVGILSNLLQIEINLIVEILANHFKGRGKAFETNKRIVEMAFQWAQNNIRKQDPFYIEPIQKKQDSIIVDGNTAAALGSIYGGLQFIAWYPITPATSLPESLNEYLPLLRKDASSGKNTYVSLQAEDELAAIGMVTGAGWAGLRSMTATSGPGLCLMSEYLGLAYFAEVPMVVWDVQRVGPSTGLPTRSSQGDLTFSFFLSHGDTDFVILIPGNVNECFEFGWRALNIADELQTPVIVLSDLELGMNEWQTQPFQYPSEPIRKGKILWEDDLKRMIEKNGQWGRYEDIERDHIAFRTVPGNLHPSAAYFTRGTGHDDSAHYSESPEIWERNHLRLKQKISGAKENLPKPILIARNISEIGIISYGSNDDAVRESCELLAIQKYDCDYLRIRAIPFSDQVESFLNAHEKVFVVEANRDGQMAQILCASFPKNAQKIVSVAHMDGLSLSAEWICEKIAKQRIQS